MNVLDAIRERRSVRAYEEKPVEQEKLTRVMEAARLAPSASNRQEWRYVIVMDKAMREKLCVAAGNQTFLKEAPVVIVGCAETDNHRMRCGQPCYPIDVAISMEHIALQAVEEGLGTCWIGAFDEDVVKKALNIPAKVRVVELMPLGYPADGPSTKSRLSTEEIIRWEKW